MKKDLPKILIKADSWVFMKPAVDLLRENNHSVIKRKYEHNNADLNILCNGSDYPESSSYKGNDWEYACRGDSYPNHKVLTMPKGLLNLKEFLGVDFEYMEIINKGSNFCGFKGHIFDNGHYSGGNGQVIKVIEFYRDPIIRNVCYGLVGDQEVCFSVDALKKSTKEAFEAQEAKKISKTKEYMKNFNIHVVGIDPIGLHAENEGLYVKIKDLESKNEALEEAYQDSVQSSCNQAETIKDLIIENKTLKAQLNIEPELGSIEYELKKALTHVVTLEDENKALIKDLSIRMPQHTEMYHLLNEIIGSGMHNIYDNIKKAKFRMAELFPF